MSDDLAKVVLEASYAGISFPVSECPFTFGHDGVEHSAFGRDGVDCEPTGQQAFKGTLVVPLYNGLAGFEQDNLFPGTFRDLIATIGVTPIGDLVHPLLGNVRAFMRTGNVESDSNVRSGILLRLEWTEHRASTQLLVGESGETPQDATQSVTSQADVADAAMLEVMPDGGYTLMAPAVATQLAVIEAVSVRPAAVDAAMRAVTDAANSNLALPALATIEAAQAIVELERVISRAYAVRDSLLVGLRRANTITTPRAMAVWEIAQQAYGDATQTQTLLDANPSLSADPLFVPAGRVVVVPPIT